jgi:hypothetical protein
MHRQITEQYFLASLSAFGTKQDNNRTQQESCIRAAAVVKRCSSMALVSKRHNGAPLAKKYFLCAPPPLLTCKNVYKEEFSFLQFRNQDNLAFHKLITFVKVSRMYETISGNF